MGRTLTEYTTVLAALQTEFFADDLVPPEAAASWSIADLRKWFEGGGRISVSSSIQCRDSPEPAHSESCTPTSLAPRTRSPGVSAGQTDQGLRSPARDRPDIVIPLGDFCSVAESLVALDVRRHAYPFDWLHSSLELALRFLESDCDPRTLLSDVVNLQRLQDHGRISAGVHEWVTFNDADVDPAADHDTVPVSSSDECEDDADMPMIGNSTPGAIVRDNLTGAIFPHDFAAGPLSPQLAEVFRKYERRAVRMLARLRDSKVLLVYVRNSHLSGRCSPHSSDLLRRLDATLRRWPNVRLECWNALDEPLALDRVRNEVLPLLHRDDPLRKKHLHQLIGLRMLEISAVGAAGEAFAALVLQSVTEQVRPSLQH